MGASVSLAPMIATPPSCQLAFRSARHQWTRHDGKPHALQATNKPVVPAQVGQVRRLCAFASRTVTTFRPSHSGQPDSFHGNAVLTKQTGKTRQPVPWRKPIRQSNVVTLYPHILMNQFGRFQNGGTTKSDAPGTASPVFRLPRVEVLCVPCDSQIINRKRRPLERPASGAVTILVRYALS